MKRILIATDSFLPRHDGVAIFLKEIIPLLREKYDITIAAPHFGHLERFEGATIVRFPLSKLKAGGFSLAVPKKKVMKDLVSNADIVFTQTVGPIGLAAMNLAKKMKKPLAAYIHSIEWELFRESVRRLKRLINIVSAMYVKNLYRKCDLLIVPSEEAGDQLARKGIKTRKQVVSLGVDSKRFIPPRSKDEAKEKLGIDPAMRVIGFVGRIAREKDLLTLYAAFGLIKEKRSDVMLLLVGPGNENEIPSGMNIKWAGSKDDVVPYYQAMDIYVLPSLTETTSLTTLEAMSCGVAVIATPVGLVKDYVETRKNGWIFPKGNVYRLNLVLNTLLEDKELREHLGRNARKTITERFNWATTALELDDVFSRL